MAMLSSHPHEPIKCIAGVNYTEGWYAIHTFIPEKPKITVAPQEQRVLTEGYNSTFKCNATGRPEPTIRWIDQNGRVIDHLADSRYSVSGGYLTITAVVQSDKDKTYTCEAKNDEDDDIKTAMITKIWGMLIYPLAYIRNLAIQYSRQVQKTEGHPTYIILLTCNNIKMVYLGFNPLFLSLFLFRNYLHIGSVRVS